VGSPQRFPGAPQQAGRWRVATALDRRDRRNTPWTARTAAAALMSTTVAGSGTPLSASTLPPTTESLTPSPL